MSFKESLRKLFNPTDEEKKEYRKKRIEELNWVQQEEKMKAQIAKWKAEARRNEAKHKQKEEFLI